MGSKKVGNIISNAGSNVKGAIGKSKERAIKVLDQNNDGKFNLDDVSVVASTVSNAVKKGAQSVKEEANDKAILLDLKTLRPIFAETLDETDFVMPKFIRILERDKKHADSIACRGSIGFYSDQKGLRVVNIFRDSIETFGLSYYPNYDSEFYYVDPSDRDLYISLDEYFGHMKVVRINELQRIAQDLGAKHFQVTYKEEQTSFSENKIKGHAKASKIAEAGGNRATTEKKYSTVEIAAEMEFPGHSPIKPQLHYMQKDPSVLNLVEMRMNSESPLLHQKLTLKLSNSSGITENDAIKIDAALKGMKVSGNTTVASEAKNESRRYLEYEIDF